MSDTFRASINGVPWTIVSGSWLPSLFGAAGTTIGSTTRFKSGIVPIAQGLAHEFHHTVSTSVVRYVLSFTIGRLWHDDYWRREEIAANDYAAAHATDPQFVAVYTAMRAKLPASWPDVLIQHLVTL